MWATTNTVKAFHEMRYSTRISRRRRISAGRQHRDLIPVLGRTVTAR
jgi:hypothetical protein